ncbi:MAG: hypothetical protein NTX87_12130, partial [Planctomycetota bacterium]|nr:hypothetical protein [Planctomycetota bacterium]
METRASNDQQRSGHVAPGNGNGHPTRRGFHIPTLGEMLFWPVNDLARLDLGFKNLLCATGLPDTMDLDIHACLKKLHEWAQ